jgi:hypothetical protein
MTDRLPLTNGDTVQAMAVVWEALGNYQEMTELVSNKLNVYVEDGYFDDINTAMAWIQEGLDE